MALFVYFLGIIIVAPVVFLILVTKQDSEFVRHEAALIAAMSGLLWPFTLVVVLPMGCLIYLIKKIPAIRE